MISAHKSLESDDSDTILIALEYNVAVVWGRERATVVIEIVAIVFCRKE